MFKKILSLLALLAVTSSSTNVMAYSGASAPSVRELKSTKEKKKCSPCSTGLESDAALDPIDKLATLGRRTQLLPFMPVQRSVFEGAPVNFVSTASGQLSFAVTDLELTGAMPLMFQRIYSSDRNEDTGLGAGWSFVFDDRITLENDRATMKTGNGAIIVFRRDAGSNRFRLNVDAPFPHQSFELTNEMTITEQAAGLTRTYVKVDEAYRLSQIADANGNSISVSFDVRGHMTRVEGSSGGALILEWSNDADARLLSVRDNTGRRVTFKQDGKRLHAVTDPAGATWTYDYEGARLTRAADPLNRTLLRVRYDKTGRVVESGDAAGDYLYDYDSTSANASRLTTVTDPMGAKTYLEHSALGMLTAITDGEGRAVSFEYNAANRPIRVSNSFGDEMKLTYDAENRLLRQWSTDGTDKAYGYDERGRINSVTEGGIRTDYTLDESGQITAAKSSDSKRNYRAAYDARGQLVSLKSDNRELAFEYDGRGNKTAFTYSDIGRFGLERDLAGRVVKESLPSGLNTYNEYDARGWLAKRSDNRGRSMRVERDQSGATIAFVRGDGKRMTAVRDETSRVIAMTDFNGSTRRYAYDARGALIDYTNTRGQRFKYEYDGQGRLRSVIKADGTRVNIQRDEKGRVRRVVTASSVGNASATRGKLLSHAPVIQVDMDDPSIDWGDPLVISIWDSRIGGSIGSDGGMALLMESTGNEGGGGGSTPMTEQEKIECAKAALSCLVAVGAYVGGIAALIAACGETLGITCLGVLFTSPRTRPLCRA